MWHKLPEDPPKESGGYPLTVLKLRHFQLGYELENCYWSSLDQTWYMDNGYQSIEAFGWKAIAWFEIPPYKEE